MPFLAQILDNADPLFALVTAPDFYLNPIEVADQDQQVAVYRQSTHALT